MKRSDADNKLSSRQQGGKTRSRKAREDYEANPTICPTCDKIIPFEKRRNRFCSMSCSATHNNQGITRHAKHPKHCAYCGRVIASK